MLNTPQTALPPIPVLEPITVRPLVKPEFTTTLLITSPDWVQENADALRSWAAALKVDASYFETFCKDQYISKRHAECTEANLEEIDALFARLTRERGLRY